MPSPTASSMLMIHDPSTVAMGNTKDMEKATLASPKLDVTYFKGSIKNIPDCYDDWPVDDFTVSDDGDFLFRIEK